MTRYRTVSFTALVAAAISFVFSCSPGPMRQEKGNVVIRFGGSSSDVRALSNGLPSGTLPTFSAVKVRVTGSDMADVETTVTAPNGSISLEVPAGIDRLVELSAVPDWAATTAAFPNAALPAFAKAYGGSTTVNVPAGGSVSAAITLTLAASRILLPDPLNNYTLKIASELSASAGIESHMLSQLQITPISDFEFDNRGYLYISGENIYRYAQIGGVLTSQQLIDVNTRNLAFDAPRNRLYGFHTWETPYLVFFNVADTVVTLYEAVLSDDEYHYYSPGSVAVDKNGFAYVAIWKWIDVEVQGRFIAKLSVGELTDEYGTGASIVAIADFASLGLMLDESQSLDVRDMTIVDGKLYIAAGANYFDDYHIGKVVEVRLSDLGKEREFGFANANYPSNPSQQFYGPMRFIAVAPRRLIIADEGLREVEDTNIDRVVELNLDTGSFDGIWFVDQAEFFVTYSVD